MLHKPGFISSLRYLNILILHAGAVKDNTRYWLDRSRVICVQLVCIRQLGDNRNKHILCDSFVDWA